MKAKDIIIGLIFLAAIVLVFAFLFSIPSGALSDETKELVEDLRWKHYGIRTDYVMFYDAGAIQWNRDFLSIWVEDGKLFVETQDGKWFIEMKEAKSDGS